MSDSSVHQHMARFGFSRFAGSAFVDEETRFDVFATNLIDGPQGRGVCLVGLIAVPVPMRESDDDPSVRLRAGMTRTLRHCDPFCARTDIEEILTAFGLVVLKKALRENAQPRDLGERVFETNNWRDFVEFSGTRFAIRGSSPIAFADRQIAKRRIIRHLARHAAHQSIGALQGALDLDSETLRAALVQLEGLRYVHRDGDNWCVSQEGEALAATRNLKASSKNSISR